MAFDEKTKAYVRRYYVFDFFTLEQAAEKAGVSFNTARRWKKQALEKGDDWDKFRDVNVMSGGGLEEVSRGLLSGFLVQYRTTMDELKEAEISPSEKAQLLSSLADSFTKMTAASKRILPEVSELAVAMKTVKLFGDYLQSAHPTLLSAFLDVLDGFGVVLEQEFKKGK